MLGCDFPSPGTGQDTSTVLDLKPQPLPRAGFSGSAVARRDVCITGWRSYRKRIIFFFLHLCRFRPFYLKTVPISHIHTDYEDGGNQPISQPQRRYRLLCQGRVLPNGKGFSYEFGASVKKHPKGCRVGTAATELGCLGCQGSASSNGCSPGWLPNFPLWMSWDH